VPAHALFVVALILPALSTGCAYAVVGAILTVGGGGSSRSGSVVGGNPNSPGGSNSVPQNQPGPVSPQFPPGPGAPFSPPVATNLAPILSTISPITSQQVAGLVELKWQTIDEEAGTVQVSYESSSGGPVVVATVPDTGSYSWDARALKPGAYELSLEPTDAAGLRGAAAKLSLELVSGPRLLHAMAFDSNGDGVLSGGDQVRLRFSMPINAASVTSSDFTLRTANDSLGQNATVVAGPAQEELSVLLGPGARIRTRGFLADSSAAANRPSGLSLAANIGTGSITSVASGVSASLYPAPADFVPGFVRGTDLPATEASALRSGDFDRDGDLDLVLTAWPGQLGQVLLNDGSGSFTLVQSLNASATDLAVGDLDRDGDLDLVLANQDGVATRVWFGNGAGSFVLQAAQIATGLDATAAQVGDLDQDGDLDLVLGAAGGPARVWLNDGSGVFSDTGQSLGAGDVGTLELLDADLDGDTDLFLGRGVSADNSNQIYLNDGSGTFTGAIAVGAGRTTASCVGDVDGDQREDLVFLGGDGPEVWVSRKGGLNFWQVLESSSTTSVSLGDLDADGRLDLLVTSNFAAGLRIHYNQVGRLADSLPVEQVGESAHVICGDFTENGGCDLVVAALPLAGVPQSTRFLKGPAAATWGEASFSPSPDALISTSENMFNISVGDLNSDGFPDFVCNGPYEMHRTYLNDGTGNFSLFELFGDTVHAGRTGALGDFDGDGDLDFVEASGYHGTRIFLNDGTGKMTDSGQLVLLPAGDVTSSTNFYTLEVFDIDRDGDLDLIVGVIFKKLYVSLNDGTGVFGSFVGIHNFGHLFADQGDLDGDGDTDLVLAGSSSFYVLMNDGGGTLTHHSTRLMTLTGATNEVVLADEDGDGDLDLFIARNPEQSQFWLNQGDGTFVLATQKMAPSNRTVRATAADIDGDGDLDWSFGTTSYTGIPSRFMVRRRSLSGDYDDLLDYHPSPDGVGPSAWADIDRDGDLDLLALWARVHYVNRVYVFKNGER